MKVLKGIGVSAGVASGKLSFLKRDTQGVQRVEVADTGAEIARFEAARKQAITGLGELYEKTLASLGEEHSLLFQIHQMMLEDLDYVDSITGMISGGVNAEWAVNETAKQFSEMFAQMDDPYMQARSADVLDVSNRIIRILTGQEETAFSDGQPVILAADDLVPSETARLDRNQVLAFVTAHGSSNSHTAIFARTMAIPAIVNLGDQLTIEDDGKEVFIDGSTGLLYVDPDAETTADLIARREAEEAARIHREQFRGKPAITPDGRRMLLCANIGSPNDVEAALAGDCDGIGLFRSEFLYLGRDDFPSEDDQYQAYKTVLEGMGDKPVIVRTLDIGADKQADYFEMPTEENPALGVRALRICLTRPEVFRTPLRALYRASAHGNLSIMFPMVASVWEVRKVKEICAGIRQELKTEGYAIEEDVPLGIMIETPAAAVISDLLAKEVDFFSIGTNDLTQYTLAADRQNPNIGQFCDTHHEAVLRLIAHVTKMAHENGIWAGICGELGADQTLTKTFMEMGLDELSMSPGSILKTKAQILDR